MRFSALAAGRGTRLVGHGYSGSGLHVTFTTGASVAGDLIGYTTGLLIAVLLLILTLRAAKLPGTPLANIVFTLCALFWCAGGLAYTALLATGAPGENRSALLALAIQYSGAAAFPIPVLAVWRPYAVRAWQKTMARVLQLFAGFTAAAIAILLWSRALTDVALFPFDGVRHFIAYNATLLLVLGAVSLLRRQSTPRAVYLPSLAIAVTAGAASIAYAIVRNSRLSHALDLGFRVVGSHLVLLAAICTFFLFARFRFADVFIRYSVRILLAGAWASAIALAMHSSFLSHVASQARAPAAVHVFAIILVANALLLSFTFVDEQISRMANRLLFRPPDYRAHSRELGNRLGGLQLESEIAVAIEKAARDPLELSGARLIAIDGVPSPQRPAGILEGEIVELDYADPLRALLPLPNVEVLIPVTSAGRVTHLLLISPGPARPGLVTHDLNYLRAVAAQCGNRLDALGREREAIERQGRETLLLQQVTEAELRALRAQINPHFLFNSLNTIADLIVRDAPRAEAMTLRLASVFRHVLQHSSRSLTSIRDEIEFLRTYLYIEEVRFGDRLQVEIDVAPEVAGEPIPALLLQPLVENALKHGLGPKPGPGHLWITARADGDRVLVTVEDDGIGPRSAEAADPPGWLANIADRRTESQHHGMANVAERLRTQYQDRASVKLEPREGGGVSVTVLIPRSEAAKTV